MHGGDLNDKSQTFRLVVKFKDDLKFSMPVDLGCRIPLPLDGVDFLQKVLSHFDGVKVEKLFTSLDSAQITALIYRAIKLDSQYNPPDFQSYYVIDGPLHHNYSDLLEILHRNEVVESAYLETGPMLPPSKVAAPQSLIVWQGYLEPSPLGIDAKYAWNEGKIGDAQVKLVDIEQGWIIDHESFRVNRLPYFGLNHPFYSDHGTAVLGTILMKDRQAGITGIAPGAKLFVMSQWRPDGSFNTADAIMATIESLIAGDMILLETQSAETPYSNQLWPVEIQDAIYEVIRLATASGITVIEAAGNGQTSFEKGNDLDHYTNAAGKRILNTSDPSFRDSGAILVAAAGSDIPHERISYSNFGNRVNSFAWGDGVFTAGSFPGSSGIASDCYTWSFAGTSSAAAIVAGASIALQGIVETRYHFKLTPKQIKTLLSQDSLTTPSARGQLIDKIGRMPDLRKIILHIDHLAIELSAKGYPIK